MHQAQENYIDTHSLKRYVCVCIDTHTHTYIEIQEIQLVSCLFFAQNYFN